MFFKFATCITLLQPMSYKMATTSVIDRVCCHSYLHTYIQGGPKK